MARISLECCRPASLFWRQYEELRCCFRPLRSSGARFWRIRCDWCGWLRDRSTYTSCQGVVGRSCGFDALGAAAFRALAVMQTGHLIFFRRLVGGVFVMPSTSSSLIRLKEMCPSLAWSSMRESVIGCCRTCFLVGVVFTSLLACLRLELVAGCVQACDKSCSLTLFDA